MATGQRSEPLGLYHRSRRGSGSILTDHVGGTFTTTGPLGVPGASGGPRVTRLAQASPQRAASPLAAAYAKVDSFAGGAGGGVFKSISRARVAAGLRLRLADPNGIYQGPSSLCGPSVVVRAVAATDPLGYVTFVTSLYETGHGRIHDLKVDAGEDLRNYDPGTVFDPRPPKEGPTFEPADWIAVASLRDSENWFWDYQNPNNMAAGITMPSALDKWFKEVGFHEVIDDTNVLFTKGEDNLRRASELWTKDHWVCLFVNEDMVHWDINKVRSRSVIPTHWIALTSAINIAADKSSVSFTVFTWGNGHQSVPYDKSDTLSLADLLHNYYGYVATRR
jgi:hypothetical protein